MDFFLLHSHSPQAYLLFSPSPLLPLRLLPFLFILSPPSSPLCIIVFFLLLLPPIFRICLFSLILFLLPSSFLFRYNYLFFFHLLFNLLSDVSPFSIFIFYIPKFSRYLRFSFLILPTIFFFLSLFFYLKSFWNYFLSNFMSSRHFFFFNVCCQLVFLLLYENIATEMFDRWISFSAYLTKGFYTWLSCR